MRIVIDAFRLVCERNTSGHVYVRDLIGFLLNEALVREVLLLLPKEPDDALLAHYGATEKLKWFVDLAAKNPAESWERQTVWIQRRVPKLVQRIQNRENLHYIGPYHQVPVFLPRDVNVLAVVHDLCGLDRASGYRRFGRPYFRHVFNFWSMILRANCVVPISEFTRREICKTFPLLAKRTRPAAYNSVLSHTLALDEASEVVSKMGLPKDYFVAFAAEGLRKATDRTIQAQVIRYARGAGETLVFIGSPRAVESWQRYAEEHGAINIVWLSNLTDVERDAVYHRAQALVFPSHCEGFGYPVVEALRQGTSVIALQNSPADEICDDKSLLLNRVTAVDISAAMDAAMPTHYRDNAVRRKQAIATSARFMSHSLGEAFVDALTESARS